MVKRSLTNASPVGGDHVVMDETHLKVSQVMQRLQLPKPDPVLRWIHSGELRAVNVSSGSGRPTWRIPAAALERFIESRQAIPTVATKTSRRRRRGESQAIEFF